MNWQVVAELAKNGFQDIKILVALVKITITMTNVV